MSLEEAENMNVEEDEEEEEEVSRYLSPLNGLIVHFKDNTGEIQLRMQNIVATVNLGTKLDLVSAIFIVDIIFTFRQDKITQTAKNAEYNPKRFQAVIMRIREPRTTALIFSSGKVSQFPCCACLRG